MALPLVMGGGRSRRQEALTPKAESRKQKSEMEQSLLRSAATTAKTGFVRFAGTCTAVGAVSGKLEKVRLLAEYLRSLDGDALAWVTTWFTGYPFPPSQNKVLQLGWVILRDALCAAGEVTHTEFRHVFLTHSDAGETAFDILSKNPVPKPTLSIESIRHLFEQVHSARGPSAKLPVLIDALGKCTPIESQKLIGCGGNTSALLCAVK